MNQETAPATPAPIRPAGVAAGRLFCFPYAGGSSRMYAGWEESLPDGLQVDGVELPGRGGRFREAPHDRIDTLVADLLPQVREASGTPYALFGYSLGALVAYEIARAMEHWYDTPPEHLFVGAFRAPHLRRTAVPDYNLPEPQFRERLKAFNGTPEEVMADESLMELIIPILRADLAVADTYRHDPGPPLSCPITAFAGADDAEADVASIAQWRRHTRATFTLKVLEGDHFFLHQQEGALLREVTRTLAVDA